jgi:hypothetical protein
MIHLFVPTNEEFALCERHARDRKWVTDPGEIRADLAPRFLRAEEQVIGVVNLGGNEPLDVLRQLGFLPSVTDDRQMVALFIPRDYDRLEFEKHLFLFSVKLVPRYVDDEEFPKLLSRVQSFLR